MYDAPETRMSLLLRLGHESDEFAWREFVQIYQPLVFRLAQRYGLQDSDAWDVVQTLMARVASRARRWSSEPQRGTFRGWLARVTRNLVIDHFRQQRRQPLSLVDSHWADLPEADVDREFDWEQRRELFHWAAERCRGEMTERTWQAFWRTSVEQQPVAEVARQLEMTPGAVYIARSRALARIRETIEDSRFDSVTEVAP